MFTTFHKLRPHVIRRPAVAGYYYPADPVALRDTVDQLTHGENTPVEAMALILPHGSYRHAGRIAGATVARCVIPRRVIVLGPSHTGSWMPWSILINGAYRTPLGDVPIDTACADALMHRCAFLQPDPSFQQGEHAVEVLLPLLQRRGPQDLSIVPIVMGQDHPDERSRLAEALAQVIRMQEEPVLLIASADLSHYESYAAGVAHDRMLLDAIESLDQERLQRVVEEESIVMCGAAAVCGVLAAAIALGATTATLVRYGTSAEAGGDPESVMGYAGVLVPSPRASGELQ